MKPTGVAMIPRIPGRKMAVKSIERGLDPAYATPNATQKRQIKRARNSAT